MGWLFGQRWGTWLTRESRSWNSSMIIENDRLPKMEKCPSILFVRLQDDERRLWFFRNLNCRLPGGWNNEHRRQWQIRNVGFRMTAASVERVGSLNGSSPCWQWREEFFEVTGSVLTTSHRVSSSSSPWWYFWSGVIGHLPHAGWTFFFPHHFSLMSFSH